MVMFYSLIALVFLVISVPKIVWSMEGEEDGSPPKKRASVRIVANAAAAEAAGVIALVDYDVSVAAATQHLLSLVASAPRGMRGQLNTHIAHARSRVSNSLKNPSKYDGKRCPAVASGCSSGFYTWLDGRLGFTPQADVCPRYKSLKAQELEDVLWSAGCIKQYYCSKYKTCVEIDSDTVIADEDDPYGTRIYESLSSCKRYCEKNCKEDGMDPRQSLSLQRSSDWQNPFLQI